MFQIGRGPPAHYSAAVDRRLVIIGVVGAVVALLLVVVATSGEVRYAERAPSLPWGLEFDRPAAQPLPTTPSLPPPESIGGSPRELPAFVGTLFRLVLYGGIAALAALALWKAWQHRPRLTWHRKPADDFETLDEVAASVAADAEAQRAALRQGTPRNAIVQCWLRLERAIVESGLERDPANTAAELTERILSEFPVEPAAAHTLAALYREARFSTHPMGEDARRAAVDALDALHRGLLVEAYGSGAAR